MTDNNLEGEIGLYELINRDHRDILLKIFRRDFYKELFEFELTCKIVQESEGNEEEGKSMNRLTNNLKYFLDSLKEYRLKRPTPIGNVKVEEEAFYRDIFWAYNQIIGEVEKSKLEVITDKQTKFQ